MAPTSAALLQELLAAGEAGEADEANPCRAASKVKRFRFQLFDVGQRNARTGSPRQDCATRWGVIWDYFGMPAFSKHVNGCEQWLAVPCGMGWVERSVWSPNDG